MDLETGVPTTPTNDPSAIPSTLIIAPTLTPSREPSAGPTAVPSLGPSIVLSEIPSIAPTQMPSFQPSFSLSMPPTEVPAILCNLTFAVFNAETGARVGRIQSQAETGAYYCIPDFNITIEAKPAEDCAPSESALLTLDGPITASQQENKQPYYIFGDNPATGEAIGMQLDPGLYLIEAKIFDMDDLEGELITSRSVDFEVRFCTSPTISPTISPKPSAINSDAPTLSFAPTDALPTPYPRPPETLFGLVFDAQGDATELDLEDAGSVVLRFLEQHFIMQFASDSRTDLIASFGTVTGTDAPRSRTWFNFTPLFSETSEYMPTQEEIDSLIEESFQSPFLEELLSMLSSELPPSNPLSATMGVLYQS